LRLAPLSGTALRHQYSAWIVAAAELRLVDGDVAETALHLELSVVGASLAAACTWEGILDIARTISCRSGE